MRSRGQDMDEVGGVDEMDEVDLEDQKTHWGKFKIPRTRTIGILLPKAN